MKSMKLVILIGVTAIAFTAAAPAEATWYNNGRGQWGGSGWGSSGWGSSGWGSSTGGTSSSSTGGVSSSTSSSSGGTQVPEPSNLLMLSLGLAGLVAGRYAARRRRKNK